MQAIDVCLSGFFLQFSMVAPRLGQGRVHTMWFGGSPNVFRCDILSTPLMVGCDFWVLYA